MAWPVHHHGILDRISAENVSDSFVIAKLSEEHGWIDHSTSTNKLSVGQLVRIVSSLFCSLEFISLLQPQTNT